MTDAAPILLPLASLTVLAGVVLLRWRMGKRWWANHAAGAQGYLRDLAVITAAILPLLAAGVAFRTIVADDPLKAEQPIYLALLGAGYVGVMIARRTPPLRQAQSRLEAARAEPAGEVRKEAA